MRSRFIVTSTLAGATSVAQLEELLCAFALELPAEVLADLERVNWAWPSPAAQ